MEVVRDEVVVAVLDNGIDESRECSLVAKSTILNGFEDLGQVWIDFVLAIEVIVTKIFYIFCQVAKEKDVLITCFTSDLDLCTLLAWVSRNLELLSTHVCTIACSDDETTIHHKFHVASTTGFCSCS